MEKYKPKKEPYIGKRRKLLINARNFFDGRKLIIDGFKNKIFPKAPTSFKDEESPRDEEKEGKKDDRLPTIEEEKEPIEEDPKEEVSEQIIELDKFDSRDLIYKYFL